MDFVRLGERYTTSYIPDKIVEGYNSLVWTERFGDHGEFELKSFDVERLGALLPEDTLVSHLETQHVMQVETHSIENVGEGVDARPEITIRGRSATTIFEHRWVEAAYRKKRRMRMKYTVTSACAVLMMNAIDNNSGKDLTRGDTDPDTPTEYNDYPWTTKDVLPNVAITETVASEGGARWFLLVEGILYPQLKRLLDAGDLGIRCLRPKSPNPAIVIGVRTSLHQRGEVYRTSVADVPQMRFDIYKGVDRSNTVHFSLLQGHLEKPKYLSSSQMHKTAVEIKSDEIYVADVHHPGDAGLTGWRRKVMEFDAGDPEIPPAPEKPEELRKNATLQERQDRATAMDAWLDAMAKWRNKRAAIVADFREEANLAALRLIKNNRRINMFSGDVSSLAPYQYKVHYDLGDTVMLYGDYGKSAKMVVSEYIRTEDINGDRGFPGLVEP